MLSRASMKTRRNQSNASTKPRQHGRSTRNLREVEEWQEGGAAFLRAVTSGSRMPDDRMIFDDIHEFRMSFS